MAVQNKNTITIDLKNAHSLADGTFTTTYMNAETGQYGILMMYPRDRSSVAESLVAANERVEELMRRGQSMDIAVDDLSVLDKALHTHRTGVLQSVDWSSMSPGLVLTAYKLYRIATEEQL